VFIAGLRKKHYRLRVKPRQVTAGTRHTFRFHATRNGRPLNQALVRFAGRRVRTGPRGNAKIRARLRKPASRVARLSVGKSKRTVASARVLVLAPGVRR
jgi:hypothetical protein